MSLLEYSQRFTEDYNNLSLYLKGNTTTDPQTADNYQTNILKLKRTLQKTDLILINAMIKNDSLNLLHNTFTTESRLFIDDLSKSELSNKRFSDLSEIYDKIITIYSNEITKEIN